MKQIKKGFIKNFWRLLDGFRGGLFFVMIVILIIQIFSVVPVYVLQKVIDGLFDYENLNLEFFYKWLFIFIIFQLLIQLFAYIKEYYAGKIEAEFEVKIINHSVKKLFSLPLAYHEEEKTGAKLEKIQRGVFDMRRLLEMSGWQLMPSVFLFIVYLSYLFYINWKLTLIFFLLLPIFLIITIRLNQKSFCVKTKIRKKFESTYGVLSEAIYNIKTVKGFAREEREENNVKRRYEKIKKMIIDWIKIYLNYDLLRSLFQILGEVVVFAVGIYYVLQGYLTVGGLVLFITLTEKMTSAMWNLTHSFGFIVDASVGVDRLIRLLETPSNLILHKDAVKHVVKGEIEFKNVSFSYGKETVIKNLNLKIDQGQVVALVGPSGGGKTTLTKLIFRYFDVDTGTILIDNEDIKDIDLKFYRQQLGMVSQDIDLFSDTIKSNIAYGKPSALMKEITKAAEISNCDEFIERLKKKYKTKVGERGVKLSGGQRQRVGIARAILKNPKILILDEATSFLDAQSEQKIQQATKRIIKNRTTIIIAHRLSTIKHADKIIYIDNGKIIEQGSHQELMKKNKAYANMIKLQMSGYLN